MMQLELFERDVISLDDMRIIIQELRQGYWFLRNTRPGPYGDARRRKIYRRLAIYKKRLLLAGVDKEKIKDMLSCYRLKCRCGTLSCRYFS